MCWLLGGDATLLQYIDQDKVVVKRLGVGGGGCYVCWLRKCGPMPRFPLGSPARSLRRWGGWGQPGSVGSGTCTTDSRYQGSVTKCISGWWFIRRQSHWEKKKQKNNRLFLASNYSKGPQKQECQSKKIANVPLSYRSFMAHCHQGVDRKLFVLERKQRKNSFS